MGADMIGYLVVGPESVSPSVRERAIEEFAKTYTPGSFPEACGNCESVLPADASVCENCGARVCVFSSADEARKWARQMIEAWPPDYRDVARRASPYNRNDLIVFAGDMSWGDEPEGGGYHYLRDLVESGLGKLIGVR